VEVVKAAPKPPAPLPQSRLFAPFRALGYISDDVPFSMFVHTPKGALAKPTIHIVSSVGRSWILWDAEKMTLLFAGGLRNGKVNEC
jgi:U3 small nucleolar RNA-associated protein 21